MSNSEPEPNTIENRDTTARVTWSERAESVFWAGIVVGGLLVISGFASLSLALVGNTTGQLVLCSGLGVIFGAFGSTATARYKGVVVTGVAAIAICLLLIVDHLIADNYVELEILGDIRGAEVEVLGDENYLGAPRGRTHKFIVIAKEIRREYLTVEINAPSDTKDGDEVVYIFECVHKDEIEPYLGSGQIIQWRFDRQSAQLFKGDQHRKIADIGPCPRLPDVALQLEGHDRGWLSRLGRNIFSTALAADPVDTQGLIHDLEAKSSYVRRQARQSLAEQGLGVVRPLLDELAIGPVSYRTRLGVVVALTEILRENKGQRQSVSALVTEADLNRLVDSSAHKDRTIRIYASEFLYDLGDVRVVPALFERIETVDDNGRYNLLIVLKGAYSHLDSTERTKTEKQLFQIRPSVGPKTQQLIDRIVREASAE